MQPHEPEGKTERLSLRIDRSTKELIERAAARDHRSLTGYIISSLKTKAELDLKRGELEADYRAMAADEEYNKEALEWIESNVDDGLDDETW